MDEYGGVTGLISMEDLLECIFGDIPSPSDALDEAEAATVTDGRTELDASMSISQFNQELGIRLDESEFETVGGLVLHAFGELPEEGANVNLDELVFTVQTVEGNRIKTLSVENVAQVAARYTPTDPTDDPGEAS